MYTMHDWERDGSLKLTAGQLVSDEVVNELINCVPPAWHGGGLFQTGEPASTDAETYKDLFDTFRREEKGWTYLGTCLLGKTEARESIFEKMTREDREKNAFGKSLGQQVVGDLYVNYNGHQMTPYNVYFAEGYNNCAAGAAYFHYDNALHPVLLCRNGEQLIMPEWAGLTADFKGGILRDFRVL